MKKPLLIVELAGPAGAGKSTLAKALIEHQGNIQMGLFPDIRDVQNLPFFLWNAFMLLPTFFALYRHNHDKLLTLRQMAIMSLLKGWHRRLRKASFSNDMVIILDQGPVYMLSDLLRFGPHNLRHVAANWWNRTCQDWASILHLVICLDAPNDVLLNRVRFRQKAHGFKKDKDEVAMQFLDLCRLTQNETLSSMADYSRSLKVVCFDTSQTSLAEVIEKTVALLPSYIER